MPLIILLVLVFFGVRQCRSGSDLPPSAVLTEVEAARVDSILSNIARPAQDPYGYAIDTLDRREVLRLLRAAQYDSLEAILDERWEATRADIKQEARLQHAYDSFLQGSPAIESHLTKWIAERPTAASARVAMAAHQWGRALEGRGTKTAANTDDAERASANEHAAEGVAAANEALRLAPDHLTAYIARLELLKLSAAPDPDEARATLQAALAAHPTSFQLRWSILGLLQPKWGGSFDLMRQFAATAEEYAVRNEKLRAIAGAVPQEEAFMQREDYGMSLALLDQAAFYGDHYMLATAHGELHAGHRKHVEALAAFERALSLSPQGRSALDGRAKLLVRIGALTVDPVIRERVWAEAEKSLKLLRDLRPPYADPGYWLGLLSEARQFCRTGPPPCLNGI